MNETYDTNITDLLKEIVESICVGDEISRVLWNIILDFENGIPGFHEFSLRSGLRVRKLFLQLADNFGCILLEILKVLHQSHAIGSELFLHYLHSNNKNKSKIILCYQNDTQENFSK